MFLELGKLVMSSAEANGAAPQNRPSSGTTRGSGKIGCNFNVNF